MNAINLSVYLALFATQTLAEGIVPGSEAEQCEQSAADEIAAIKCYDEELKTWDDQLNAAYGIAIKRAEENDARGDLPAAAKNTAASLIGMQQSWIIYRDELCELQSVGLAPSNTYVMARTQCLLLETARQTKLLELVE